MKTLTLLACALLLCAAGTDANKKAKKSYKANDIWYDECGYGYTRISVLQEHKCYHIYAGTIEAKYAPAEHCMGTCRGHGSHVLSLRNSTIMNVFKSAVLNDVWLGAKKVNGKFRWQPEDRYKKIEEAGVVFGAWEESNFVPPFDPNGEDCVMMKTNGNWVQVPCNPTAKKDGMYRNEDCAFCNCEYIPYHRENFPTTLRITNLNFTENYYDTDSADFQHLLKKLQNLMEKIKQDNKQLKTLFGIDAVSFTKGSVNCNALVTCNDAVNETDLLTSVQNATANGNWDGLDVDEDSVTVQHTDPTDAPGLPEPTKPYDEPGQPDSVADMSFFGVPVFAQIRPNYFEPLGMQSGVITDAMITSNSENPKYPATSVRPSKLGWKPLDHETHPYIQVDFGVQTDVYGIGTLDHVVDGTYVAIYILRTSDDAVTWTWLYNLAHTDYLYLSGHLTPNTWMRHNLDSYYGSPVKTRYLRLHPMLSGGLVPGLRMELYGKMDPENQNYKAALAEDRWTMSLTGCGCYGRRLRNSGPVCACCHEGGCQCSSHFPNQCVECGHPHKCGTPDLISDPFSPLVDMWTKSKDGCPCPPGSTATDCACCVNWAEHKRHACPCGDRQPNQCVRCGSQKRTCGARGDLFGKPKHCKKVCPAGVSMFPGDTPRILPEW